jgi:hypothetical protein
MCASRCWRLALIGLIGLLGTVRPAAAQLSDDFNRASLGPDWTVVDGTWDISSNQLRVQGALPTTRFIQYTAAGSATATQYCGFRIQGVTSHYYRMRFRENSSTGNHYQLELGLNESQIQWYIRGAVNATIRGGVVTSGWSVGDEAALTVTGTGINTIVYVWRNPPSTIPTSASTWDGSSTPLHTLTVATAPSSYADDGTGFGLGARQSAIGIALFDDWRAGSVGAGGGGGGGPLRRLLTMGIGLLWFPWWWLP